MMLIVCPQCAASYQVAPTSVGPDGRSVRCVNCHTIWFATPVESALENAGIDTSFASPAGATDEPAFHASAFPNGNDNPGDFAVDGADGPVAWDDKAPAAYQDDLAAADIAAIPGADSPLGEPALEPAIMGEAPSIVPPLDNDGDDLRFAAPLPGEDIESLAARRETQSRHAALWHTLKQKLTIPGLPTIIVLLGGIILVLLASRNQVVRFAPQTASFYALLGLPVNLRGLDFENIRVSREMQDGIPVLVVEGKIVGTTSAISEVPRLRFAIHDETGKEVYTWSMMPSRTLLAAGETLPFRSRLASPPAEAHNVSIRFFNRRDAISGFR